MHAAHGLLEALLQPGRAKLQHDGAGVPCGAMGVPHPPSIRPGNALLGAYGPRGAPVDAAHRRGP